MDVHNNPSSSNVQQELETTVLCRLKKRVYGANKPDSIHDSTTVEEFLRRQGFKPDDVWEDDAGNVHVVECYLHVGKLKAGQVNKIGKDILKLITMRTLSERYLGIFPVLRLLVTDDTRQSLSGNSRWMARALTEYGVLLDGAELSREEHSRLATAQQSQAGDQVH